MLSFNNPAKKLTRHLPIYNSRKSLLRSLLLQRDPFYVLRDTYGRASTNCIPAWYRQKKPIRIEKKSRSKTLEKEAEKQRRDGSARSLSDARKIALIYERGSERCDSRIRLCCSVTTAEIRRGGGAPSRKRPLSKTETTISLRGTVVRGCWRCDGTARGHSAWRRKERCRRTSGPRRVCASTAN